ncbi:MAG: signal peptidase II [Deltaproteobacteria bacterium]|nr:MAG: signal peptidase II [Deltaproteobacteria bacterium]
MKKGRHLMIWPAIAVFCLDQVSKWLVAHHIPLFQSRVIIPGLFNLVHTHNRGIAFGLLNRDSSSPTIFLITAASLVVIVVLIIWYVRSTEKDTFLTLGISLIMGGTLGNMTDRLRLGLVVDFLDIYLGRFHWPAFNVADSSITIGTFMIGLSLILSHKRSSHAS